MANERTKELIQDVSLSLNIVLAKVKEIGLRTDGEATPIGPSLIDLERSIETSIRTTSLISKIYLPSTQPPHG
jgi:hypothetical protein